jgi:hypothetical protein
MRSFLRTLTRSLVGRDIIWSSLPASLRQQDYFRIQREAATEAQFAQRCASVFDRKEVLQGPVTGLRYRNFEALGSAFFPKLVGSYEAELHSDFERILRNPPRLLIDIGFAEGYYLIGLGRRLPETKLVGYDINDQAHQVCEDLADLNDIAPNRLSLHSAATFDSLKRYLPAPALVICDCEGFEATIFNSQHLNLWAQSNLVIECHDFLVSGITKTLSAMLSETHQVNVIHSGDDRDKIAFLSDLAFSKFRPNEKIRLITEGRPCAMQWIIAETRHPGLEFPS